MARPAPELRQVHRHADRIEPRMVRAMIRAAGRLSARVPLEKLAETIAAKDQRTAARIIDEIDIEDSLVPITKILRDAFVKGGKNVAEELK